MMQNIVPFLFYRGFIMPLHSYLSTTMSLKNKYGPLALVAGASEGLGAAFATYLAAEGMDLVLVARRKQPLDELAQQLQEKYKVKCECISCDLSAPDAAQQLQQHLSGKQVNLLVYNAALSYIGPFEQNNTSHNNQMAQANMITPLNMVQAFGSDMLSRNKGAIVLMASVAGFQGSGFLSVYAATKAFNRVFAESLWYEWKERGVDVIACCAGATATPNYINSDPGPTSIFAPRVQSPAEVVKECFEKLGKRPSFVTGTGNKIASFIMQNLMPRKMAITIMGDTTRKMYRL
jgi:short-subunit dehydrogenase